MMNHKKRAVVIAIVAAVALATLVWWLRRGDDPERVLTLYGNVDIREVELAFRQPGRIVAMAFDEGDTVTAGQQMARLDAEPYREAVAAAEADVQAASAELDRLLSGNRPQEIARAEESVREAQATLRNAARDFERQSSLLASGASSQRTVDAARAARDQAAAGLASAEAALSLARAGFRDQEVDAGKARLAAAKAARTQARTALADTRLTAPASATVLLRVREPGSMVTPGTPVYTLSLRDPVYVRAYVEEPDLGRIAPGMKARIETDSSDRVYEGQIGFISPRAEFTPKSVQTTDLRTDLVYRLRIVVPAANRGLRQGMPVTVRIDTAARPERDER